MRFHQLSNAALHRPSSYILATHNFMGVPAIPPWTGNYMRARSQHLTKILYSQLADKD